jgi:DNA-binding HxlR family transcriptional regulator
MTRSTEHTGQEKESFNRIVTTLGDRSLSWSQILKETKLSRRTLSQRLKDMKQRGLLTRKMDTSPSTYPPNVHYTLTKTAQRTYGPIVEAVKKAKHVGNLEPLRHTLTTTDMQRILESSFYFAGYNFLFTMKSILEANIRDEDAASFVFAFTFHPSMDEMIKQLFEQCVQQRNKAIKALDRQTKCLSEKLEFTKPSASRHKHTPLQ